VFLECIHALFVPAPPPDSPLKKYMGQALQPVGSFTTVRRPAGKPVPQPTGLFRRAAEVRRCLFCGIAPRRTRNHTNRTRRCRPPVSKTACAPSLRSKGGEPAANGADPWALAIELSPKAFQRGRDSEGRLSDGQIVFRVTGHLPFSILEPSSTFPNWSSCPEHARGAPFGLVTVSWCVGYGMTSFGAMA
jgi:hypothetical protein